MRFGLISNLDSGYSFATEVSFFSHAKSFVQERKKGRVPHYYTTLYCLLSHAGLVVLYQHTVGLVA
jgi:hypothetical protein